MRMTNTALKNRELEERERSNKASERETQRSNKAKETETHRHNRHAEAADYIKGAGSLLKGFGGLRRFNDPSWYVPFTGAGDFVARVPARKNSQTPIKGRLQVASSTLESIIPMCRCYVYYNTLGGRKEQQSNALNQSLIKLRNTIRSKNSRIGQWESGDLGQYLIAATELHTIMAVWRKAILAASTFSGNKYKLGDAIIYQCGFKPGEMRKNLAAHIAQYNLLAAKINVSVYIPKEFNYYARKLWIANIILSDDELAMSQVTHYRPFQFGVYDEANAEVEFVSAWKPGDHDLSDIVLEVQGYRLEPLQFSSAISEMTADLFTGFGSDLSAYYQIPAIEVTDRLEIAHATEPLTQMMNAVMVPLHVAQRPNAGVAPAYKYAADYIGVSDTILHPSGYGDVGSYMVTMCPKNNSDFIRQDSNGELFQGVSATQKYGIELVQLPTASDTNLTTSGYLPNSATTEYKLLFDGEPQILNFYQDNVSEDDLIVATRLRPVFGVRVDSSGAVHLYAATAGTEVLACCINSKCYAYANNEYMLHTLEFGLEDLVAIDAENTPFTLTDASFDWNPMKSYALLSQAWLYFQSGNIMNIESVNLKTINEYCLTGLFSISEAKGSGNTFSFGKGKR